MRAPSKNIVASLSAHAVIGCVRRFLGVTVDIDERQFGTSFAMWLHLYAAGVTYEQVEAAVMLPSVKAALEAGATRITVDGGVLIADRGTVITVFPDDRPRFRQKSRFRKHPTRAESHRLRRKMQTREKRRPVPS